MLFSVSLRGAFVTCIHFRWATTTAMQFQSSQKPNTSKETGPILATNTPFGVLEFARFTGFCRKKTENHPSSWHRENKNPSTFGRKHSQVRNSARKRGISTLEFRVISNARTVPLLSTETKTKIAKALRGAGRVLCHTLIEIIPHAGQIRIDFGNLHTFGFRNHNLYTHNHRKLSKE